VLLTTPEKVVRISETHLKPLFRCEIDIHEQHIDNVIKQSKTAEIAVAS
jgi:hypothetical protein